MKLLLLFAAILVAGVFTQDHEEEPEPSLCVEHQNPFSYTHCIKKRDTGCQNGGFCGTCNSNSCQTCTGNGNNCRTSCNGAACNQCPNGNCCDGQNCNVCSGRNCCSGSNCNNCVNTCNQGCSTPACRSTCFQTCQGNSCCDRSECFSSCRNQCFGDHCYENCFKQCPCPQNCTNPSVPTPGVVYPNITIPAAHPPQKANQTIVVVNKPENHNPVNISTVVNLKNYIISKNVINTPINITNVNHNHINESRADPLKDKIIEDKKCCIVIYPIHCYDISEHPYKKCVQKREKKCGEICTSVVVHVVHVPGKDREVPVPFPYPVQVPGPVQWVKQPYPVPVVQRYPVYVPLPGQTCGGGVTGGVTGGISGGCGYRQICHYINRYPWISCGHYGVQNCGSCYVCGGQYNPGYCSQQVGCAGLCRGNIVNFGATWQHDILRQAPFFNAQYSAQQPAVQPQFQQQQQQAEVPLPAAQLVQQPQIIQQPVDLQQQAYVAVQQPVDLGVQQQYVQQPVDLGVQQQFVQQPADLGVQQFAGVQQQPIEFQRVQQFAGVQQQPIEFQQGGIQQQYVVQQPYEVQQPYGGVQQQFGAVQHPIQIQQQPAGFAGK